MRTTSLLALACVVVACGGSDRRSQAAMQEDGVPVNSLSDKRLEGDSAGRGDGTKSDDKPGNDKKRAESTATPAGAAPNDPTQPYLTPVATSDEASSKGDGTSPGAAGGKKTGKVSKAECGQLFDRYIELAIGSDARLEGVPPELVQQAKAMARQQKGDPCEKEVVPRAKFNCAMAATTPAQWQKCLK